MSNGLWNLDSTKRLWITAVFLNHSTLDAPRRVQTPVAVRENFAETGNDGACGCFQEWLEMRRWRGTHISNSMKELGREERHIQKKCNKMIGQLWKSGALFWIKEISWCVQLIMNRQTIQKQKIKSISLDCSCTEGKMKKTWAWEINLLCFLTLGNRKVGFSSENTLFFFNLITSIKSMAHIPIPRNTMFARTDWQNFNCLPYGKSSVSSNIHNSFCRP